MSSTGADPRDALLLLGPASVDTLRTAPSNALLVRTPGTVLALRGPFCSLLHVSPAPDGSLVAATGEDGLLSRGRLVGEEWVWEAETRAAPAATPLTRQDDSEILSRVGRYGASREQVTTAPVKSGVYGLEVGTDGTIWVRLTDQDAREVWVAHDPETHTPEARLTAPEGVALKAFAAGLAFGVWRDELDIQYVMVFSIR